jgi:hypothetical protein
VTSRAGPTSRRTESAVNWLGDIEKDLDAAKAAYKKLIESDLDEFNKR